MASQHYSYSKIETRDQNQLFPSKSGKREDPNPPGCIAILDILPTNGGETLVVLGAILLGVHEFPLTPVQVLWVNMITAVTLALALAFEPPEPGVMARPPRDARQPVLTPLFLWRVGYVSLILITGTFGLFLWEDQQHFSCSRATRVS